MNEELFQQLVEQALKQPRGSQTRQLSQVMATVEQLQEHGIALRDVHADLMRAGLQMTFGSFENALSRIRKRRKREMAGGSPQPVAGPTRIKAPQIMEQSAPSKTQEPKSVTAAGPRAMAELSKVPMRPRGETAAEAAQRRDRVEKFREKFRRYRAAEEAGRDPGPFNEFT